MLHYFESKDPTKEISFSTEAFSRMSKLRFLHLKGIILTGNFEQTLEDLRWFCWEQCPLTCLPSEFCPQDLIILKLPHSKITALWELNMVSPVFENLKTLDMSFSQDLVTTPDFSKLPCLTTLILDGCESLEDVHISIGSLPRLVFLDLTFCVKLRILPDTICNLRALKSLRIDNCSSLKALPKELGNIGSLTQISAWQVNVGGLPDSLGRLSKLVRLSLAFSSNIKSLPNAICNLRTLEVLDITCCHRLSALPKEIGNVKSLRKLYAPRIDVLKLPDSLGSLDKLVVLTLNNNYKLKTLPDTIGNLTSLKF
ncbi:uncharacterized protein LOC141696707 [Apium graveolens]|uniref:uncharacterized protein LOC141696707 n=1 Tax=Apium graveolens TaxID=4045 RepID=UPI003D78D602